MARRAVIEKEELFEVANSMVAEGKPVTALNLKDALGGGSLTTIYKYLADWESSRETVSASANGTEVPDAVQNAFLSTWRVAANEAAKQVAAVKEKAAEEVRAAQRKFEEALRAIQKLESDSEQDGVQIEILKSRIAELEQTVSQLSNDNAAARATAEQLRHQVKSQQTEIDRLHKDMERENNAHREQMERLNSEYSNAQAKSVEQIQGLHKEKDAVQHRAEQSDSQIQSMGIKIEHLEKEAQTAQQNLAHSATERDSAMKEASELRGQIAALKEQNAQLVTALAQLNQAPKKGKDKE